ncbi:sensor domain-containing protein [Fundidesulfovibrio terrae]|uniref:sensor domain-containing protein n=1 Tax=Fundidesulfovibrio terrae TaxID=2922866 RepID=UPI001FAFF5A5|nr:bifunctional diguanylate cyclase/phosphodiesterase [Fundidesulfovibrio terrae]
MSVIFDFKGRCGQYFRNLFDKVPNAACLIDRFDTVFTVNAAFEHLFGYPLAEIEGRSLRGLIIPPGRENELAGMTEALARHGSARVETTRVRRDGSLLQVVVTLFPASENPDDDLMFAVYTDIQELRETEKSLQQAEDKYRSIFEHAAEGIFQTAPEGRYLAANPALARIYGYDTPGDLMDSLRDIEAQLYVDPGRRDEFVQAVTASGQVTDFESRIRRKDGSIIWISENARAVRGENGQVAYFEGMVSDITARKQAEEALKRERALLKMLFEGSPQAMVLLSPEGRILDVNPAFVRLFGHDRQDIVGEFNRHLIVPEDLMAESESFFRTIDAGLPVSRQTIRKARNGMRIPVSVLGYPVVIAGRLEGIYYIYEDITERKNFEEQLTHQAFHDALTGLPNRNLFTERLSRAMERSKRRPGYHFAVLLLDLDRFKRINDSLGHLAGDMLLKGIARRLEACLRSVDTVARLGGDEFAVLLEEFASTREVIEVADRIKEVLDRPFQISGNEVYCGASIGIVLRTQGYSTPEEILRDSDTAMYRSKESGKDRLAFTQKMREAAVENLRLENELRHGLKNGDLVLHYQPVVRVPGGELLGFEALARWNHPERGMIPPARFIPLAEETGLIIPLGEWVLAEAMRQLSLWREEHLQARNLFLTVNISSKQFRQTDLVDAVRRRLSKRRIPPELFKLEITESVIMRDAKSSAEKLGQLKALGIQLLVDDFGTGYSSLSYLQRFPIDGLKIDRSFVSGDERENVEIVRTIVSLARTLELDVVAEGVETAAQLASLADAGCQSAQGYWFARPLDAESAGELVAGGGTLP